MLHWGVLGHVNCALLVAPTSQLVPSADTSDVHVGTACCVTGSCHSYPGGKTEGRLFWALSGEHMALAFCLEITSLKFILNLGASPISFS